MRSMKIRKVRIGRGRITGVREGKRGAGDRESFFCGKMSGALWPSCWEGQGTGVALACQSKVEALRTCQLSRTHTGEQVAPQHGS